MRNSDQTTNGKTHPTLVHGSLGPTRYDFGPCKLGCVVRMVVDSLLPMRNAGQKTIGKTHPRLVARFLFSRPRTNHIFCVLLIQFKNMLSDLGTRRYRLYLLIRFKKSPKPVSRFHIFKFSRFSNFR